MKPFEPSRRDLGDDALELCWPGNANVETSTQVWSMWASLQSVAPAWLVHAQACSTSLRVAFSADVTHEEVEAACRRLQSGEVVNGRAHTIPVRYDGEDLEHVAQQTGLTVDEVIARHSAPEYVVAFTGFVPGFPYLLGLDASLHLPRRETPRPAVPAGSVAIAGSQAGIYPKVSPGGWHLLGTTDVDTSPGWITPGDTVRFTPVLP